MRLYIIRHGQTSWNVERRLQGRSDIALNENGRALAAQTAEGMKNIPFDLAFTSPLRRARETAELILKGRDVPVAEDGRIIEISFGIYEGRHWTEKDTLETLDMERATEDEAAAYQISNFFYHPERYVPARGGETLAELAARTADFMRDICARPGLRDKTILVSTHGAALRGLLNSMRSYEMRDFWGQGVASNCGLFLVECVDGRAALLEENRIFY